MDSRRVFPTRGGRWGIRQLRDGELTGGGTIGLGWPTKEEAEAANPPVGVYTFEAYPRWDERFIDLPPVGDRVPVEFECCGRTIQNYLRPSDPRICLDCRAEVDRAARGWSPENSRD